MNKGIRGIRFALVALAALVASSAYAKGGDAIIGSWTIDTAKSSMTGRAPLTSGHSTWTAGKDGLHAVLDLSSADGKLHYEFTAQTDGTPAAVTGNTYFDSCTLVRLDKNTMMRTERRGGHVVGTTYYVVAKDSKTMNISTRGLWPDGSVTKGDSVWNRAKK
jgi:hypothetical protein